MPIRCLAGQKSEFPALMPMHGDGDIPGLQFMAKSAPASKRGFPELRRTHFLVMTGLLRNAPQNGPVSRFLDKKRTGRKPCYVYMTAGANKYPRIYCGKAKAHLNA